MTGIIHLFWSVTTGHGTAGAVLGWLTLCGAADIVATVTRWLGNLAATVVGAIRRDRGDTADVVPLERAGEEAPATGSPARERD